MPEKRRFRGLLFSLSAAISQQCFRLFALRVVEVAGIKKKSI